MKRVFLILALFAITAVSSDAQLTPDVTSWIINTTGATGYAGIPSNVQQVQYSANNVYVSASCIPGYSIGPWTGNPNIPINKNFVFKITRNPVKNTGALVTVGLGHIGVWSNGVSIYNSQDAMSYNGANVWLQNAYYFEGVSFDACLGHPDQGGEYHHHVNPKCLYNDLDSTHHSPLIGFAFDGFPIYGAYAYADTNGTGGIKRMRTSYQLRTITTRTTLPDGTAASSAGPAVSTAYPIGDYVQDYIYVAGSGDLDDHNGRFCKTPEYPNGIYAYFVTVDASLNPVYPYVIGPTYYGTVQAGNTNGPGSGHNTITETVTTYNPVSVAQVTKKLTIDIYPNPAQDHLFLYLEPIVSNNFTVLLIDMTGKVLFRQSNIQPTISYALDISNIPGGTYLINIRNEETELTQKVIILH